MKVKHNSAAGKFYPADRNELLDLIDNFYTNCRNSSGYYSRAVIVPHAGYIFSGQLAAQGYMYLNPEFEKIFIIAPSHYSRIYGCLSCDFDEFETPLGNCKVDKDITKEFELNNEAFDKEHSVEVQLPFIKYFFKQARIIPILYGCENYKNITKLIEKYWHDEKTAFVISSDLSHFYPEREACKLDRYTAQMIETGNIQNFDSEQACGAVGICGITNFAALNGFTLIRAGLTNSAARTGDSSRVVGYGSWFLCEGTFADYIKAFYSDYVIDICKKSIMSGLQIGDFEINTYPCAFEEACATFVTLEIKGELRGCIGSVIPYRSLMKDLMENAHSAAFKDLRFEPLSQEEFDNLSIKVSILSQPERIIFESEDELLNKITPYKDGIIIRDGNFQAVYLPSVWAQLPDKQDFMRSLKLKAGMSEDYFSETFQAFKFKAVEITQ